jgi:mRNA interferase MazF
VDAPQTKQRPALVLSSEEFNRSHGHSWRSMITSALHGRWPTDVTISDLSAAGLKSPPVVRFKVSTLDHRLVAGSLGKVSAPDWNAVEAKLGPILQA